MVSISSSSSSLRFDFLLGNLGNSILLPACLSSSPRRRISPAAAALKVGSEGGGEGFRSELLRKPVVEPSLSAAEEEEDAKEEDGYEVVDWEDQILEDTVPLVGIVRMILHSGKYEPGDRLSPKHERTILEKLLPYHPECDKKIGCGVDYITIGYHPTFETSRCLFIVRKDGELVDFSYWKCIKGLIRKNYPLYADSFILRHFRRRNHA